MHCGFCVVVFIFLIVFLIIHSLHCVYAFMHSLHHVYACLALQMLLQQLSMILIFQLLGILIF